MLTVLLLLLSAVLSSSASPCNTYEGDEILCTCHPGDVDPIHVSLSSFDNTKKVTIANCENVNFAGGCSYESPPTIITFRNITHLNHHLTGYRWPKDKPESNSISRIEFVNIMLITELHLNELYPRNQVDLLLIRNVTEIKNMSRRFEPVYQSNVKVLSIESSMIKELEVGSIALTSPKLVSINKTRIFYWRSRAVNVSDCQSLVVTNDSMVSFLENHAVVGQFEEVVFNRTSFGHVRSQGLRSMRVSKRLYMDSNTFMVLTPNSLKTYEDEDSVHVDWINNSMSCKGAFERNSKPVHRICLRVASQKETIENITCFQDELQYQGFNDVSCWSSSAVHLTPPIDAITVLVIVCAVYLVLSILHVDRICIDVSIVIWRPVSLC